MFVTNQWFHVVTIADKSKDSAYAYLNGVLIESKLMGVNTTIGSNALSLLMGKGYWTSNGVPSFYFNGKLDDIGIWNRALTPEEVVELYSGLDTCTTPYYSDLDNDGYGGLLLGNFCSAPPNGVLQSGDCDDANPSINPGVPEICNGVDDDCDGSVDDGLGQILGNISGPAVQCDSSNHRTSGFLSSGCTRSNKLSMDSPSGNANSFRTRNSKSFCLLESSFSP